jgi:hypothetical protein
VPLQARRQVDDGCRVDSAATLGIDPGDRLLSGTVVDVAGHPIAGALRGSLVGSRTTSSRRRSTPVAIARADVAILPVAVVQVHQLKPGALGGMESSTR